jgi:hypothetical protein
MKNIHVLFSAVVCGLVLSFTAAASAQNIVQGVATVVRVRGEASYTLESGPNAKWIPLVAGKVLKPGSTIKTEPDAMADVVLGKSVDFPQARPTPDTISLAPDSLVRGAVDYRPSAEQNVVRLSGGTTFKIDKLTISDTGVDTVSDTELDLQKGRIFFSVKKLSPESKYLIKIPNGIAGVRGTQGMIDADDSCAALQHSFFLSITGPDGQTTTILIEEGKQFNPATGQLTPLSPELIALLHEIATALDTLYLQVISVSISIDGTLCFISPTSGFLTGGLPDGGNQGGGGNVAMAK